MFCRRDKNFLHFLADVAHEDSYGKKLGIYHKDDLMGQIASSSTIFAYEHDGESLRAAEIGAEIVLKATNVDGIYTDDPKKNPNATLYKEISFDEAMVKHLKVINSLAFLIHQYDKFLKFLGLSFYL